MSVVWIRPLCVFERHCCDKERFDNGGSSLLFYLSGSLVSFSRIEIQESKTISLD